METEAATSARIWVLCKAFEGKATLDNFELIEEKLPPLKEKEILVKAMYLTVDPYMRVFPFEVGQSLVGQQVAEVIESKNSSYPVGMLVLVFAGWRDKTVLHPDADNPYYVKRFSPKKMLSSIPNLGDFPPSIYLGALGMPGMTAYFGLLEKCRPKAGDIVLVNAAAGAVGSLVGQIAKIKGCTVIGSAGTQAKCDWLKRLGFDAVFNYKEQTVEEALQQLAPDGVDCYFDNVGGKFTDSVLFAMSPYGRVCCCGQISNYQTKASPSGKRMTGKDLINRIMLQELSVNGIMVYSFEDKFDAAKREMAQWIKQGLLKFHETCRNGFQKLPEAFIEIFNGTASGKLIVSAQDIC